MNKTQLIEAMAQESGLAKADAKKALDALTATIGQTLKKGENIALIGFGTFSVNEKPAREGRNPQTGAKMKIAAKKVVKFKAGSELSELVK